MLLATHCVYNSSCKTQQRQVLTVLKCSVINCMALINTTKVKIIGTYKTIVTVTILVFYCRSHKYNYSISHNYLVYYYLAFYFSIPQLNHSKRQLFKTSCISLGDGCKCLSKFHRNPQGRFKNTYSFVRLSIRKLC